MYTPLMPQLSAFIYATITAHGGTGRVPVKLRDARVHTLDVAALLSNTMYRGQLEARVNKVLQEVRADPRIILFVDEIHTIVQAGAAQGGALDVANMLKSSLARGDIKVIGATTTEEYNQYIKSDAALERRFIPLHVPEPSPVHAVEILRGLAPLYAAHHSVKYSDACLQAAVSLSALLPNRRLPDVAIDLIDTTGARMQLRHDGVSLEQPEVSAEQVAATVADWVDRPLPEVLEQLHVSDASGPSCV
jgi:ATP-dependent Clp protease ATP-binding subunit ClpC